MKKVVVKITETNSSLPKLVRCLRQGSLEPISNERSKVKNMRSVLRR